MVAYLKVPPVGLILGKDCSGILRDNVVCALSLLQVLHFTEQSHQLCQKGGKGVCGLGRMG